ncbi:MAG: hypothetical protein KJ587_09805, partial [Alphaproteobacteria bacterium]|nr:hypothetical protein [Alphaproteobacteria bacterium]
VGVANPSILKTGRLTRYRLFVSWLAPPSLHTPTCAQRTPAEAGSFPDPKTQSLEWLLLL